VNKTTNVNIRRLPGGDGLPIPTYKSDLAAGLDLSAAISEDVTLAPGAIVMIPVGFAIALPAGFEAQVRPRSGLAAKYGVTVCNTPGTIDADYRGEVRVILINHSDAPFTVSRGTRIAQMVIAPVTKAILTEVDDLPETTRGSGGFGSTGTT